MFDPFEKITISNIKVDNQNLTSNRTPTMQNNVITNTLKVLHQRF